jgi:phospholipase C
MIEHDRRQFLKTIAGMVAAGTMPASIGRALALPAARRSGSIADVEHVVILMQENRSFDHYFGTLRGVRGYGDPRPMVLRSGASVFHQPTPDGKSAILPFHMDCRTTSAPLVKSLDHDWKGSAAEWAEYDTWIKRKTPLTMGHFRREDIPFYHALADAFTICDGYYASLQGPTNPNRMYLFTGTSGLSVGDDGPQAVDNADDGNWTGDSGKDRPDFKGAAWTTYAERLQAAGISWRVYQEYDNFGDNSLAYFARFRGLPPTDILHRRGRAIVPGSDAANADESDAGHLVKAFAEDVAADRLPQVSWIVAPTKYSEHPYAPPAYGESLTARLLDALTANPAVWGKTALILNYDENDGFFDHMPAPLPAVGAIGGKSTVDTRGELYQGQAVGLGVRVPLLAVSPWSRGGWVSSQVFDHTSVIRFLERRFGVIEPNISPWRRAVAGDLTGLFDFDDPDGSALSGFPATDDYLERVAAVAALPGPVVPTRQALPVQEPGRRPARALPYDLAVREVAGDAPGLTLAFVNDGAAAAVFNVYAGAGSKAGPWFYTVGAGETVTDSLAGLETSGRYAISVHGPNGFLREFAGRHSVAEPEVSMTVTPAKDTITLTIVNRGEHMARIVVRSLLGGPLRTMRLASGASIAVPHPIIDSDHWYDILVEQEGADFARRLAGHVETGKNSRSDPAIKTTALASAAERERIDRSRPTFDDHPDSKQPSALAQGGRLLSCDHTAVA